MKKPKNFGQFVVAGDTKSGTGWTIKRRGEQWSQYTVHPEGDKYALFHAIADVYKGIDAEDEKMVANGLTWEKVKDIVTKENSDIEPVWVLYKLTGKRKRKLCTISLPADCWGDELYEYLDPFLPKGKSIDDYNFEGDSSYVAVMGKTEDDGEFCFEFKEE